MADPVDRLFALPPEEFVAARDALAQQLRAEGDRARAAEVRALRRPTVAAWAVNQVARRRPADVAALVEVGEELHRAQRRALSGVRETGLREASRRRRELVDGLVTAAVDALEEAGRAPGAHGDEIAATFEAASVDAEIGALVAAGRLSKEQQAVGGFAALAGLTVVPASRGDATVEDEQPDDGEEQRRAAQLAAARARAAEARGAARAAERDAEEAAQTAQRLGREAEAAARAAERAERAARNAAQSADEAQAQAERRQAAARRAEDAVVALERP
jgi:hypothetical protein